MCGIAGLILRPGAPVDESVVWRMTDLLSHRGPDGRGVFVHENVGLGNRRLAVIEPSNASDQPIFNEDGSVCVVFNGEIYNYRELRQRLLDRGHRFRTESDTEVIVHAWEEFGPDCLSHLRGMFGLCIYDDDQGVALLARDRLGKKPLFYSVERDRIAFGSEIKSIASTPAFDRELDLPAFLQYATYGHSVGERTIYRTVRKLLPGHCMTVHTRDPSLASEIRPYWSLEIDPDERPSEEEWLEELDRVLSDSIRLRMISDVPLGAFLSGGVDSSLVVAYMARHSPGNVKTFTIGFREADYDESSHAAAVAAHLGTEHHVEIVTPDAMEILSELVDAYDEPFADSSAVPTFLLSKMTREHVTVALSGDGGDELFLGYERYPFSDMTDRIGRLITPLGRGTLSFAAGRLPYGTKVKRGLERFSLKDFELFNHVLGFSTERLSLLRPELVESARHAACGKLLADFEHQRGASNAARYQYTDILNYLPDDILVKVDRASMHHSLEVRCPLLDHEFVELAARIPERLKRSGFSGKLTLKKLLERHVPRHLFERSKQGFAVPINHWFRKDRADLLKDVLADTGSRIWEFYDREAVDQRVRAHLSRNVDSSTVIWRLLFFHRWCQVKL